MSIGLHAAALAAWLFTHEDLYATSNTPAIASMVVLLSVPDRAAGPSNAAVPLISRPTKPSTARHVHRPHSTNTSASLVTDSPVTSTNNISAISEADSIRALPNFSPPQDLEPKSVSSDPTYLHHPKPVYPMMSRRLGEQGTVLVRVWVDAHGQAQQAEISRSSGYARLDQTALNAVLKWRFEPGKRHGIAEAMWLQVPLEFRLE